MVWENSLAVCCAVCGCLLNITREKPRPGTEWMETILLRGKDLSPLDDDHPYLRKGEIEEIPVSCNGGPSNFEGLTGEIYCINNAMEDLPCIAMHPKCLEIAKRVLAYHDQVLHLNEDDFIKGTARASAMDQLYEVYTSRAFAHLPFEMAHGQLKDPYQYFGLLFFFYETGEFIGELDANPSIMAFMACPFPIPNLTQTILSYLNPMPKNETLSTELSSLGKLPPEIINKVRLELHPFEDPALKCTRLLLPKTWRELLFDDMILPWLWDLDSSSLRSRSPSHSMVPYDNDKAWDWERLVRELSQTEIFEPGSLLQACPPGLRNRRRIWRLASVARQCDVPWKPSF